MIFSKIHVSRIVVKALILKREIFKNYSFTTKNASIHFTK